MLHLEVSLHEWTPNCSSFWPEPIHIPTDHTRTNHFHALDQQMDSVRCMFDAYEPKQQQRLSFPLAQIGSYSPATLDVEILSATDNDPAALQSGIYMWPASRALSAFICAQPATRFGKGPVRILELGAGVGLAGIVAFKRLACLKAHVVLTDRDQVSVDLLTQNLMLNAVAASCGAAERLSWGRGGGGSGKSQVERLLTTYGRFDVVFGSDLIYSSEVCSKLLWTVKEVLSHARKELGKSRFILCSSFRHEDTTKIVEAVCQELGMQRECLSDRIAQGETMIEEFTLLPPRTLD